MTLGPRRVRALELAHICHAVYTSLDTGDVDTVAGAVNDLLADAIGWTHPDEVNDALLDFLA